MTQERTESPGLAEVKKAYRKRIRELRNALSPEAVADRSRRICERIGQLPEYRRAKNLLCYMAFRNEVDCNNIMLTAKADGKRIFLPKVEGEEIRFYEADPEQGSEALMISALGIREPCSGQPFDPEEARDSFMLMPGLVFDEECTRFGYGGGFYDRFLAGCPMANAAVAYELQILREKLPRDVTDICPDRIITEDRIYSKNKKCLVTGIYHGKDTDMSEILELCKKAKTASAAMARLGTKEKNQALLAVADALTEHHAEIIKGNKIDMENAEANGMSAALKDRLLLTEARMEGIAEGVRQVAALDDPIGEVLSMKKRPNGLMVGQMRVPMGVIGIIYESRPNVTVDSFALTFKTGNATILRGGSDCIHSNMALVRVIRDALEASGVPVDAVQLVENTDRALVTELMQQREYVDLLIPRGGAGLIRSVVENAKVPVIETGTGNCHIYIDKTADLDQAVQIVRNAKLQRLGVCNAAESLVIHKDIAEQALPLIAADLASDECEIRGDEAAQAISNLVVPATEEDYGTEYLAKIISARIVGSLDEAIAHINRYSTGHSEAILTRDYASAQRFLQEIDSACVYVNASTRFTDGFEFGFGAEIGISTQKLHARGPMGLLALTSTKYIIYGDGQTRP